ncbi:MAG: hypothetical protein P1V81_03480 [Planctomycetota bacterium]|nr:hypothetical protein [Planctomycetota bacterium]
MEEAAPELETTTAPVDEQQVELDELEQHLAEMRAALEVAPDADTAPEESVETTDESDEVALAEPPSEQATDAPGELESSDSDIADAELADAEVAAAEVPEAEVPEADAELTEAEAEQAVEDELTAIFNDPNEMFPVEMIDGVAFPSTSPFNFEGPQAELAPEEHQAEQPASEQAPELDEESDEPDEQGSTEEVPADEMVEEVTPEVLEDPVAMAGEPELVDHEGEVAAAELTDEVDSDEATEDKIATSEVEPLEGEVVSEVAMDALADSDPLVAEALPELPLDATLEVAPDATAADAPDEALAVSLDEQPDAIEFDVPAGPVADPETDPAELFAADAEVTPVFDEEQLEQPAEVAPEELLEPTPESMDPEALADLAPVPMDLPEGLPATNADALVWIDGPAEPEALTPEFVDVGSLHAGLVEPATIATLPPSLSFLDGLDPVQRAIAAPMMLLDPSGFASHLAFGGPDLASSAWAEVTKPEEVDAAMAALPGETRVDGSEFGPVFVEDKLRNEPGLGLIWWGEDVPFLHVDSTLEVQTPSVGRVRVVLESGDYVEGLLHSVGTGSYRVDGDLGRFAVDGKLVSHVERLPKPGLGAEVAGMQAGDLVRVKAATGYVEGRLVSMKGENVLIETADGMRITLSGEDVQPMGNSATRVVLP